MGNSLIDETLLFRATIGCIAFWESSPPTIRTWTNSAKNCCATVTLAGNFPMRQAGEKQCSLRAADRETGQEVQKITDVAEKASRHWGKGDKPSRRECRKCMQATSVRRPPAAGVGSRVSGFTWRRVLFRGLRALRERRAWFGDRSGRRLHRGDSVRTFRSSN